MATVDPPEKRDRESLFRIFFLAVLALLLVELARLATPFLPALMGAAVLTLTFYPLHDRLARRLELTANESAALTTTLVLLIVVLPIAGFGAVLLREASILSETVQKTAASVREIDRQEVFRALPASLQAAAWRLDASLRSMDLDLAPHAVRLANRAAEKIVEAGGAAAKNAIFVLFNLAIMVLVLFHAFRDGARLLRWALRLVPMAGPHKQAIARRVYETFQAIVVGAISAALAQGLLATFGYWVGGVKLPILLGLATTVAALFPGSFLVTVPTALYVLSFDVGRGVFLLVWAIGVVGVVDNVLKPILIGTRARLPILVLFFGMFGAVRIYGLYGLILGPLLITALLSFIQIYRQEYFTPLKEEAA